MEPTPGFHTWGVWLVLGIAVAVVLGNIAAVAFIGFLLIQVLLLELPRWKPPRWTTPCLFPREWRE